MLAMRNFLAAVPGLIHQPESRERSKRSTDEAERTQKMANFITNGWHFSRQYNIIMIVIKLIKLILTTQFSGF